MFLFILGLIVFTVRLKVTRKNLPLEKKKKFKLPSFRKKKNENVEDLKQKILQDIENSKEIKKEEKKEEKKPGDNYYLPSGFGSNLDNKNESKKVDFDRPFGDKNG